jgi:acyl-CoA thioesterase FadM
MVTPRGRGGVATYTTGMGPARRLSHHYQVRFDEAGAQGRLRPSGYLRYAQDMAWRHSESAGFGREWYADRALTWLVRNVSLRITAAVTYGEVVGVTTEVIGWRHVWARRQGVLRRGAGAGEPTTGEIAASGEVVATVDTDWVLLGGDGRPARVPDEIAEWFAAEPTFERSRVLIPDMPPDATRLATRVRPLDVDPMGHMNNAAYLDVVDEVVAHLPPAGDDGAPDDDPVGCLYRVGYLQPALPGARLEVAAWRPDAATIACRICDDGGAELTRVLISRPPFR